MAADDAGAAGGAAEDVGLEEGPPAGERVVGGVEELDSVDGGGAEVAGLVDRAATAVAKDADGFEVGEAVDLAGGVRGRLVWERRWDESWSVTGGGVGDVELEVGRATLLDDGHGD